MAKHTTGRQTNKRTASNGGAGALPPDPKTPKAAPDPAPDAPMAEADSTERRLSDLEDRDLAAREIIKGLAEEVGQLKELCKQQGEQLRASTAERVRLTAQLTAMTQERDAALAGRTQQAGNSNTRAASGASEPVHMQLERAQRDANRYKVVIFPKGRSVNAQQIRAQLMAVYGLPTKDVLQVFPVKTLWIVRLATPQQTLDLLHSWYSLYKATGWGMDQALTRQQLQERALIKDQFKELKAAGGRPCWRGSELYVRMRTGVKPAAEWDPTQALPARQAATTHAAPAAGPRGTAAAAPAATAAAGEGPATAGAETPAVTQPGGPQSATAATVPAAAAPASAAATTAAPGGAPSGSGVDPRAPDYDPLPQGPRPDTPRPRRGSLKDKTA